MSFQAILAVLMPLVCLFSANVTDTYAICIAKHGLFRPISMSFDTKMTVLSSTCLQYS